MILKRQGDSILAELSDKKEMLRGESLDLFDSPYFSLYGKEL